MNTQWRIVILTMLLALAANNGRAIASEAAADAERTFIVAADPNNLPFSNEHEQGFENKLAQLIAGDLHATLKYVWQPQRRGFFRNMFGERRCDAVMGVPPAISQCQATAPYYRSSFAFVVKETRGPPIDSLDDPRLRQVKIGAQMMGDGQMSPPAELLVERGLAKNLVPFSMYSDDRTANPPAEIVKAVADGRVDAAVAWGPLAGYFARNSSPRLLTRPIHQPDGEKIPLAFDIAVGVRKDEPALRDEINKILKTRRAEIATLLDEFGVPRVEDSTNDSSASTHHE
jgi:mxaJ protein